MNNNEKLIAEARDAMITHYVSSPGYEWNWHEMATIALTVFEKARTPTDDEREALNTLYWTHPDGHTTGLTSDAIDAILAAGFTPEQVDPSDARVSVAAKAVAAYQGTRYDGSLRQDWDNMARAALRAAGGVR